MSATLTCLDEVGADLSDGHAAFRSCLANLELDSPVGKITLDENRQAIGATFISEVIEDDNGNLVNQFISMDPGVPQNLRIDPDKFAALGAPSRDNPPCQTSY